MPFIKQLLEFHNFDLSQIIELDPQKIYHLSRCYISSFSFWNSMDMTREMQEYFSRSADHLPDGPYEKIYISRKNASRNLVNEEEICAYLQSQDFHIVDFASMSVVEQIKIIRGAREIVAPHGASGANLLYMTDRHFKFVEIFSNIRITMHARICSIKNCSYSPVFASPIDDNAFSQCYLDIDLLKKALCMPLHIFTCPKINISATNNINHLKDRFSTNLKQFIGAHPTFRQKINNYKSEGNYKTALNDMICFYNDYATERDLIEIIMLAFLADNEKQFTKYLDKAISTKLTLHSQISQLISFVITINHKAAIDCLLNKYSSIFSNKEMERYNLAINTISKYGYLTPYTIYNTYLSIDDSNSHLDLVLSEARLHVHQYNQGIALFAPAAQLYINSIDSSDFSITMSPKPTELSIEAFKISNFCIKLDGKYLIYSPNGKFNLEDYPSLNSRFFLQC